MTKYKLEIEIDVTDLTDALDFKEMVEKTVQDRWNDSLKATLLVQQMIWVKVRE